MWLSRGDGPSRFPRFVATPGVHRRASVEVARQTLEGRPEILPRTVVHVVQAPESAYASTQPRFGCGNPVSVITARARQENPHARRNRP